MTQPNVQKRGKTNNKVPDPGGAQAQPAMQPQIQTIMAVVVPVEIYEKMKDSIKCLPHNQIELLLQTMKNLQPQQVNMQMPPPQIPQA